MSLAALVLATTWAAGCGNQSATSSPPAEDPAASLGEADEFDQAEGGSYLDFEGGSALGGIDTPAGEFEAGSAVNSDDPFTGPSFSDDAPDSADAPENLDAPDRPDSSDASETPEVETE